ncbi:MAG: hypothetical protein M1833_000845 [Piccolia ochrophora]|nr:MAG: hypothetical protein M1833_000845 [Piccolia ochrophora]
MKRVRFDQGRAALEAPREPNNRTERFSTGGFASLSNVEDHHSLNDPDDKQEHFSTHPRHVLPVPVDQSVPPTASSQCKSNDSSYHNPSAQSSRPFRHPDVAISLLHAQLKALRRTCRQLHHENSQLRRALIQCRFELQQRHLHLRYQRGQRHRYSPQQQFSPPTFTHPFPSSPPSFPRPETSTPPRTPYPSPTSSRSPSPLSNPRPSDCHLATRQALADLNAYHLAWTTYTPGTVPPFPTRTLLPAALHDLSTTPFAASTLFDPPSTDAVAKWNVQAFFLAPYGLRPSVRYCGDVDDECGFEDASRCTEGDMLGRVREVRRTLKMEWRRWHTDKLRLDLRLGVTEGEVGEDVKRVWGGIVELMKRVERWLRVHGGL